jgi:hypothetical protein
MIDFWDDAQEHNFIKRSGRVVLPWGQRDCGGKSSVQGDEVILLGNGEGGEIEMR